MDVAILARIPSHPYPGNVRTRGTFHSITAILQHSITTIWNRKMKTQTGSCGCEISTAKSAINKTVYNCSRCKGKCCEKHYYFQVDGNNKAITKSNFKNGICAKCYERNNVCSTFAPNLRFKSMTICIYCGCEKYQHHEKHPGTSNKQQATSNK